MKKLQKYEMIYAELKKIFEDMNAETKALLEWKWKMEYVRNLVPLKMHYAFIIACIIIFLYLQA